VLGRLCIGVAICFATATAIAAPRKVKVRVESDPEGAAVYLNTKESGAVCTTPCFVDVALGDEVSLIVEKERFEPAFEPVPVQRIAPRKQVVVTVKLEAAVGYVVVEGPGVAKGATIQIDGTNVGVAPKRVEVESGAHLISVTSTSGSSLYDGSVELVAGEEKTITPASVAAAAESPSTTPATDPPTTETHKHVDVASPRNRFVMLSVAGDVAFRSFSYDNVTKGDLRDETESGQVLVGPVVEVWPTELLGIGFLRGLSVMGRLQFGANNQVVSGAMISGPTTTFWRSFELSVRQKWTFADSFGVEIGAGYVRDQFEFNGLASDVAQVPDTDYKAIRIGGKFSMLLGSVEPYVAAENRIVLNGGDLADRLRSPTTSGLHGSLGIAVTMGWLIARLEGSLTQYSWTFKPEPGDMNQATGASDVISSAGLTLGFAY
jgi:hypothetical protein